MRAPPLPKGSFVLAVQVDHTTKSLLIDGRPHVGMGFYLVSRSGAPPSSCTCLALLLAATDTGCVLATRTALGVHITPITT
jgi:hypothetical protein